jgi:xanthine/CO dehydrogenase XdhC/CoxF family maturation factor
VRREGATPERGLLKELRDILRHYDALVREGGSGVLASVVRAEGSTYRRPGARMLVLPDGHTVGVLSGGCLEGDLVEHARAVHATGEPALLRYDAAAGADVVWGLGLGCAGILELLLERVGAGSPGPLELLRALAGGRQRGVLATVLRSRGAAAPPLAAHWSPGASRGGFAGALGAAVREEAARALAAGRSRRLRFEQGEQSAEVLVEVVKPPVRLVIFGAGADAVPVVRLAAGLGWNVEVVDGRPAFASPERFPGAALVVLCTPAEVPARIELDADCVALLMTHHYLHDQTLLRHLLPLRLRYLGVLGPRRRTEDLLGELCGDGFEASKVELERLFAPAGLDVGGDSPQAIALAVVAEIQTVLAGRSGAFLRDRAGPLHEPGP